MPATRPTDPRRRVAALLAASLVVLSACGVEAGSKAASPVQSGDIVGSDVGETTTVPQTTTTTTPPTDVEITGTDGGEVNDVIGNAISDLEAFWTDAYPDAYQADYEPLSGGLFAIDSSSDPSTVPCAGGAAIEEMLDNAFYCPPEDAVVWDQERFMPDLAEKYGPFTVAVVVAHEWGHAIQERAGVDEPSVIVELQADCFAGAWVKHVKAGDSERFQADTDQLDEALAGVLSLRDAAGGDANDPFAHGSGFDRVGAFQDGFEEGVTRCAEFTNGDPKPFQWRFSEAEIDNQGDLPLAEPPGSNIIDLTFPSLDRYWKATFPTLSDGKAWDPMGDPVAFSTDDPPSCNGETVEDFLLFVCIPDRYVGFDVGDTLPAAYEQNGDFAVATLFATQYGLDVVSQLDSADDEVSATLQADCFAGSWAADRLPTDEPIDPEAEDDLVLSPGDLDEGVAVLLSFRSDADRKRQGPGFDRVLAYRRGVLKGAEACLDITGG